MIPFLRPEIPHPDDWLQFYEESIRKNTYTNFGPCFEKASAHISNLLGMKCLPVSNGTVALEIALRVKLKRGCVVAIPDFTFAATLLAVKNAGMVPMILPTDPSTWCLDTKALHDNWRGIDAFIVVSPFGYRVDFGLYDEISAVYDRPVIYDCAAGFGLFPDTANPVCYSFHATKNMPIGEGGAVCFSNDIDLKRAKCMTNFGMDQNRTVREKWGTNAKLDEIHCAMLLWWSRNLERVGARIGSKTAECRNYMALLKDYIKVHDLFEDAAPQTCVIGGFKDPAGLVAQALKSGICLRRYYYPLVSHFARGTRTQVLKSDPFFETTVGLPTDLVGNEQQIVVSFIKGFYK